MTGSVLFEGGRVYTGRRYVEALLVEDGRVLLAGSREEAARGAPVGVEKVRLDGALVVPGLADAHLHVSELAWMREGPPLGRARSAEELVSSLSAWAKERPREPIVGRGFDLAALLPGEWPTARVLDRAVDDRPVLVYDRSGHVALLNSRALERLDLSRAADGAADDGIGRGPAGEPNGILYEEAMRRLGPSVTERQPPSTASLGRTFDFLTSLGLTSVGAMSTTPEELDALRALAADKQPFPRVRGYVRLARLRDLPQEAAAQRSGVVAAVGVKAFLDGAFGPRTASLFEPYSDLPSSRGRDVGDDRALLASLEEASSRGLAPALHAIGERAVHRAARLLDALSVPPGKLARIEHASLTTPEALASLARSRPVLVVQPGFVVSDLWLTERLGPQRARWAYAFRTLADRGFVLAGSSDAPYDPADPWRALRAAVHRHDPEGRSASPEPSERLPPEEAFALYTTGAGRALGLEGAGLLEPGAPADLLVLSAGRLSAALEAATPVAQTWIRGRRAFPAGG